MDTITGRLIDETVRSRALYRPMRLHIYLPPGYDGSRGHYPAVYLLHPWGEDERYWTECLRLHEVANLLIEARALPPFIGVMPQGDKSFFVNAEDPGGDYSPVLRLDPGHFEGALNGYGDYGDYVLEDVIPFVERKLRVRAERAARVIAGLSMGAAGAAVLAFTYPTTFGAVGIHSPVLFGERRLGPPWIFGLGDPDAFARRDPTHLARTLDPRTCPSLYLDCGQQDEHAAATKALHETLSARGIRHVYASRPGRNDAVYWQTHLAEYLGFYAAGW